MVATKKKIQKKRRKKQKLKIKKNVLLIGAVVILVIIIILVSIILFNKSLSNDKEIKKVENKVIELENYNYYLHGNATSYEESLAKELKKILSSDSISFEEYAKTITKMFVSDLFTLNNKNSSSDITSSQYVYIDYQETFKTKIKNTLYANIEVDLDGKRKQDLPEVTNVTINNITNNSFSYNNEILDDEAYYVSVSIEYNKNLGYPDEYEVVLVKNDKLLQVVKSN